MTTTVLLGMAVAAFGFGLRPGGEGEPSAGARAAASGEGGGDGEVVLDEETPLAARRDSGDPARRGPRPVVVEAVPPGGRRGDRSDDSDEPPARILRENAKLRRELDHLKALEAERRRVSRRLRRALAQFGGTLPVGTGGLLWPVPGSVVSPFGQRWGRLHAGVDIAASAGTPIYAAQHGRVVLAGWTGGYGNYVCVQHTRALTSCYAHLSRYLTRAGTGVRQGEPIGLVGCTGHCFGDHLHFETWVRAR
ncbi:MAG TPA: M23 family metallopeptidase, partial [Thermoleophilaceae bacterium]|nr:M23 family metallopeptidase [Thermoleophilaceae bacterium]